MAPRYELFLEFKSGQFSGQRATIRGDRAVIGNADYCDLVLTEEGVSAQHAVIRVSGEQYIIHDLGSVNGVWVNNERIREPKVLYHNDRLVLGAVKIRVRIPGTKSRKLTYKAESLEISDLGEDVESVARGGGGNTKRLIIFGGAGVLLLIVLAMFFLVEPPPEGEEIDVAAVDDTAVSEVQEKIEKEIEEKQERLAKLLEAQVSRDRERIEEPRLKPVVPTGDSKQKVAREKFERGMKELRSRNYIQAETEFNLSLALNPTDMLVSEYLSRTRRKRRTVAMEHYELGKQYFSSLRYELARDQFQKGIVLLEIEKKNLDNESKGYVEVIRNIETYLDRIKRVLGAKK